MKTAMPLAKFEPATRIRKGLPFLAMEVTVGGVGGVLLTVMLIGEEDAEPLAESWTVSAALNDPSDAYVWLGL